MIAFQQHFISFQDTCRQAVISKAVTEAIDNEFNPHKMLHRYATQSYRLEVRLE